MVTAARGRFGVRATAPVLSCYEAGRDGFWIHRALEGLGVRNVVVDSASIEVNRRARRMKTDKIDARKLVILLVRVTLGDTRAWRTVRVPSVAVEAARQVSRDRAGLVSDRTRVINQMRGWLTTWGIAWPARRRGAWWTTLRDWSGAPLAATVQDRLARATARLALLDEQIATLNATEAAAVRAAPAGTPVGRLWRLKGVGVVSLTTLIEEGLEWRAFQNRRQVGALLGFTPTCYDSGTLQRDTGISRAGNPRLQSTMVQLAWSWLRSQPASHLAQWYQARFGEGRRARRIGIVALARKLLIALWRYATTGLSPSGAVLKAA
jgi:transposase